MTSSDLDLLGPLPAGRLVIDASAGTGKTYSLSALVVRHVAERGLSASALLLVTFTRAAAAELRDRTRRALVEALDAMDAGTAPAGFEWMEVLLHGAPHEMAERRQNLSDAVSTFDDATITTIHGFCQQALRQLGMSSGASMDSELSDTTTELIEEVCRDLVVQHLHESPDILDWAAEISPSDVLRDLKDTVRVVTGNPGATTVPSVDGPHRDLLHSDPRLDSWVHLVKDAVRIVGERRRARQEMGYDDLVTGLHRAVHDEHSGCGAVATLRGRYQLVLVDEFQDTDPLQWETFATIFDGDLITVGDPKQAIYRFRGADVQAYLRATVGQPTVHLGTNFRSDPALVAATNALVCGVRLGDERIVASPVKAPGGAPASALNAGLPLSIRRLPTDARLLGAKGRLSVPLAKRSVMVDLISVVIDLLRHRTIDTGRGPQPVGPGDIAVLVPSNSLADEVMNAFSRAHIPAVRARTGSVLETSATDHWDLLLAALERPSHAPTVRAAGLGLFFRRTAQQLDPLAVDADQQIAVLQQQCATWADDLGRRPFLAWCDQIRTESKLATALLATPHGERDLTDLDHVAELLAGELGGRGTTAATARRALARLRAGADGTDPGPQMRRIDSDAAAVQITTLHGSKGLEYPVVLLPFSPAPPKASKPLLYNDPSGQRTIDIASGQGWSGVDLDSTAEGREHHARVATRGDHLRLLYVGLTRARHLTVVWWMPRSDSGTSALNTILFDRDAGGAPLCTEPSLGELDGKVVSFIPVALPVDDDDAVRRLNVLSARSKGLISIDPCPVEPVFERWVGGGPGVEPTPLALAAAGDRKVADPGWRRWSFTSITNTREDLWVPTSPIAGGTTDEPDDEPDGAAFGDSGGGLGVTTAGPDMAWADIAAGTAFGSLVHSVLERIDPTSAELEADLHEAVWAQLSRDRLEVDPALLVRGLAASLRTPLGPVANGLRLCDIPITDRLAELTFDMPLASAGSRATVALIGEVLLDTLPSDDPQIDYARSLAADRFEVGLAGYLQGSIDAVLRVPDGDGHRFIVVDYKTNRLHARGAASPLDHYHPQRLPAAMAEHDYPLQSILYSVALHRYLRWRLPSYLPEAHLGGIAYLFLRGMVGERTPVHGHETFGVFTWRPPAATILALDQLLARGGG
jgi:exodeoxyribonuclease V beta subunit